MVWDVVLVVLVSFNIVIILDIILGLACMAVLVNLGLPILIVF